MSVLAHPPPPLKVSDKIGSKTNPRGGVLACMLYGKPIAVYGAGQLCIVSFCRCGRTPVQRRFLFFGNKNARIVEVISAGLTYSISLARLAFGPKLLFEVIDFSPIDDGTAGLCVR